MPPQSLPLLRPKYITTKVSDASYDWDRLRMMIIDCLHKIDRDRSGLFEKVNQPISTVHIHEVQRLRHG
ncbi:hypothetical protein J6590_020939 [Homalodisca vitripennis]|nr:hypothetical protein J6590_020939 [Homalodisca vitripennis]